jgi:hypothetical protein
MGSTEHTVRCKFGILGAPPVWGMMTWGADDYARFVSDDGKSATMIHRSALGDVTWV